MKEILENDDNIREFVRKEGLLTPSDDFTSRVIGFLEEKTETIIDYQPLLSRKAWTIIIISSLMTMILCWTIMTGNTEEPVSYSAKLEKFAAFVNNINISIKIDGNALLIVTLAMISMGILLWLDLWLSNKDKRTAI